MKIDIARCLEGMKKISVDGVPLNEGRRALIEEAIGMIQGAPLAALKNQYIAFKNYAHFGDQRCDCEYGMGPRHGSIVFSIGRVHGFAGELNADCIYFLECFRDFGSFKNPDQDKWPLNLAEVLCRRQQLAEELETYSAALEAASVEPVGAA